MGGTVKRIGKGIATGGMSELGGGGKNGGPTPPDFNAAAEAQANSSHNNTNSTFGSSNWTQGPDGRWTQNMSMAPELQGAADKIMGQLGQTSTLDPGAARDQAIESAYGMQASRLDPRFAQARSAQEAQLANEGFSRGDAGWNTGMDEFNRSKNDAYQQALLGAQSGAGNTAFGQSLAANQQAAMQPYQQLSQIRGLGEGAGMAALGQAQPLQSLAAAMNQYGGDLQKYGIQQQGKNSMMGGAANLGALALL